MLSPSDSTTDKIFRFLSPEISDETVDRIHAIMLPIIIPFFATLAFCQAIQYLFLAPR